MNNIPIIDNPDDITPSWLTQVLREVGHLSTGEVTSIFFKTPFSSRFAQFMPFTAHVSNDAGHKTSLPLILKRNRDTLWGTFETVFYRDLAPATPDAPVAPCYATLQNKQTGASALLLRDLSDTHRSGQDVFKTIVPTPDQCKHILSGLLTLHVTWWNHPRLAEPDFMTLRPGNLRMSQVATPELVHQNTSEFLQVELPHYADTHHDVFPKAWQERCEKVLAQWPDVFIQRITHASTLTLIHADTHRGNLMYPKQPDVHHPIWIDWQTYTRGLPTNDLAYWLWTSQPVETRCQAENFLLQWYYTQLISHGISNYSQTDLLYDYRLSLIINLFSALKWMLPPLMDRAMAAFDDWNCMALLS